MITATDIDDVIRNFKSKGVVSVSWNQDLFFLLQQLLYLNGFPVGKKKFRYLGVEHREDKRLKKEFKINN